MQGRPARFSLVQKKAIQETTTMQGHPARFSLVQKKKFGKQQQIKGVPLVFHWYKKKCNYYGRDALTFIRNRTFLQQLILKQCSATYLFQFQKKLKFLETILISQLNKKNFMIDNLYFMKNKSWNPKISLYCKLHFFFEKSYFMETIFLKFFITNL